MISTFDELKEVTLRHGRKVGPSPGTPGTPETTGTAGTPSTSGSHGPPGPPGPPGPVDLQTLWDLRTVYYHYRLKFRI